jgi:hypothetical protein
MSIQSGYGFVHFPLSEEGVKSALTAISNLDGITINHITLDCSISNQLKQVLSNMEQEKSRKQVQNNYLTGMNKVPPTGGSFGQPSPQSFSMPPQQGGGGGIPSNFPAMMNGRHQPPQLQVQPQQQQLQTVTTTPQIDMSAVAGLPGGSELMGKIANLIHDYTSNPRVNPAAAVVPGPQAQAARGGNNFPVPPGMTANASHSLSGNDLYRPPAPVLDVPFNMANNHGSSSSSRLSNEGKSFNPSTYGSGSFSEPKSYSNHETPTSSHQPNQHFFRGSSFHEELTPTERFSNESRSYGSDQDKSAFSFQNQGNNMSFLNSNNSNSLSDPFASEPTFAALNGSSSSNNNNSNSGGFDSSSYTRKQSIGHENDDDEIMKLID